MLQTEFEFELPKGYVDQDGNLHKKGIMRLATAKDEIAPLQDPRVQRNQAYLLVILLSRVITKLGELKDINPAVIEGLFSPDLAHLQDFYQQVNQNGQIQGKVKCPNCHHSFELDETHHSEEMGLGE
ncbi:MAG: phage tail assembly protein [Deltaproteobacteria bacterium]|nr:phage tail assembly protein [Deltaproteobacteria bacterium]